MVPQYVTELALAGAKMTRSGSRSPLGPVGSFVPLAGTHGFAP